jgi:AbiV family abortive infection protein
MKKENDVSGIISFPLKARNHLEKYWILSRSFFDEGDYALATFFSIFLIEEVGKVILLRKKDIIGKLNIKDFYNHQRKYLLAVSGTLVVNSRVSRIYGNEESKFAKWFRDGDLIKIRNSSIYLEFKNGLVEVPADSISREDSCLLVCIAGEIYGEIQGFYTGTDPSEWMRIINEVDEFRKKNSIGKQSDE